MHSEVWFTKPVCSVLPFVILSYVYSLKFLFNFKLAPLRVLRPCCTKSADLPWHVRGRVAKKIYYLHGRRRPNHFTARNKPIAPLYARAIA